MEYCRSLGFTNDPDYSYIIGLFNNCMQRNSINVKVPEYIWNSNRLFFEKEALKANMMKVLAKPINKETTDKKEKE